MWRRSDPFSTATIASLQSSACLAEVSNQGNEWLNSLLSCSIVEVGNVNCVVLKELVDVVANREQDNGENVAKTVESTSLKNKFV